MTPDFLHGFSLGDFYVDPLTGQVSGAMGIVHLPPKAVEVLLCLAKNPGELVSREELLADVWGPGHGNPESLSHAVSEIRHALNDQADHPKFVQTLPKRGYRLLLTPEIASAGEPPLAVVRNKEERPAEVSFVQNLKQRGVLETSLAYLIVGWLLIQVADIVFDRLHLQAWVATFVTVLVIAGFPIAVILSWYLEFRDGRAVLHELSAVDAKRRRFSRTYVSVIAALVIASMLVYVYDQRIGLPEAEQPDGFLSLSGIQLPPIVKNSFAVLPFLNLDGSEVTQVFANGLVDDVITRLLRVPGLRVASRGDSFALEPNTPSQKVRERLRVAMYLEGSVEMTEEKLRVTVQLIDSKSGFHVLARTFDRAPEDFFDVRDDITTLTVANIRPALPLDMRSSTLAVPKHPSLDVWLLYRRGVDASRQPTTIDTISAALGWFDAALEVDHEFAAAFAGKCTVYVLGYVTVDDPGYIQKAESACAAALAQNPNLAVVHTALGDLYVSTGRYADAVIEYKAALAVEPTSVESLFGLGDAYLRQKKLDEAEASLRQAVGMHPGDSTAYNTLGGFFFRTGRYEEAAAQYQYVVGLDPNNMHGYANLGTAHMLNGDFAAAAPAFQRAIEIRPTREAYTSLGLMHYYLGDLEAAISSHTRAVELAPNNRLARSNLGDALWIAGRTDAARREFEIAESLAMVALQVNPKDAFILMDLAWARAMLDKSDDARALMDRARGLAPDDPYTHYYDGLVLLRAGNRDAALTALEMAVAKGYSRHLLGAEPHLASLKDEPGFSALINTE